MATFEQIQAGLAADVTARRQSAAAYQEGANEEKARWREVFRQIPRERQKMATRLLSDRRCQMTEEEIVQLCQVGQGDTATPREPTLDPSTQREQALAALAVTETCRLLGKPIPATLPELPGPIPRVGRGYQIDPTLQIAAEALAKRLAPITCQS
jgi:hypothetical protein